MHVCFEAAVVIVLIQFTLRRTDNHAVVVGDDSLQGRLEEATQSSVSATQSVYDIRRLRQQWTQ